MTSITVDAVAPLGESLEELRADLEKFRKALTEPVLRYQDIVGNKAETPESLEG